jgi:hypothetical protein
VYAWESLVEVELVLEHGNFCLRVELPGRGRRFSSEA